MKRWDVRQGKAPLTQPTALFRGCDRASILELMAGRSFHLWLDATCRLLTWPLMKQTAVTEVKPWREAHRCLQEGTWSLHSDGQMLCRQGQRDKKPLMKWSVSRQGLQPAGQQMRLHADDWVSITKNYFSRTFQEHLAWLCLNSGFIHASEGTEPNKSTFTSQW